MTGSIALYMRLSSEDAHAGESFSIGNQRELLHNFVKGKREFDGCTISEFCDDGYTGTNFNRPDVQKMLSMAGNSIPCIIVKDFSRFGRNLIDVGDYLDQIFPFLGVRFIAVNENYNSRNSIGSSVSLDISLKAMIYEMYSHDISEETRCVQQAKMRKGEYLCAIVFYGYQRSQTKKNKLEIDEPAAGIVRRIFQMAVMGRKPVEIAQKLNLENVPSPLMYRKENHTDGLRGWTATKIGETSLFSGLLRCADCGNGMKLSRDSNVRKDGHRNNHHAYICCTYSNGGAYACTPHPFENSLRPGQGGYPLPSAENPL